MLSDIQTNLRPSRQKCWHHLQLLTTLLVSLTFAAPGLAQEKQTRVLTVTGRGVENVQTTKAQVSLGVEAQAKTAREVQQEVARRSAAVVALLKSRGVEKLQTTGISLNPAYNYQDNKPPQLTGFTGSNVVSFQIETEQAGALLDEAVRAGATRIDSLSFIAADEAIAKAQQQALREAVQDAQAQAGAVLGSLNFTTREIVNIQVNGADVPPTPFPRPQLAQADVATRQAVPTPVIGGEQEVQAAVTLQISY